MVCISFYHQRRYFFTCGPAGNAAPDRRVLFCGIDFNLKCIYIFMLGDFGVPNRQNLKWYISSGRKYSKCTLLNLPSTTIAKYFIHKNWSLWLSLIEIINSYGAMCSLKQTIFYSCLCGKVGHVRHRTPMRKKGSAPETIK